MQLCGCQDFAKDVGRAPLGRRLALLGPMRQCTPASTNWNVPVKYGPHGEHYSILIKEEQVAVFERSAVQALCLCGNTQGVCADRSAPVNSRG